METETQRVADSPVRVLEVSDLTVVHRLRGARHGSLTAVDGVSLSVDEGEIVGIVGESGSGKTSLALAVSRLGPSSGGAIALLGENLGALSGKRLRRSRSQLQMIFQDPQGSLDPRQSVRSGLSELRWLYPERCSWIEDGELLERVKLVPAMLGRYPHQLSGGQAQRVCIARALLTRPRLLIADEPTSGLDVLVQAEILRLLLELRQEMRIAILLITHDLGVVRRICDSVYVMLAGAVVEHGPADSVLSRPQHEYTQRLLMAVPTGRPLEPAPETAPVAASKAVG
jgi:peptide/nickel transport system ATP-binding protein